MIKSATISFVLRMKLRTVVVVVRQHPPDTRRLSRHKLRKQWRQMLCICAYADNEARAVVQGCRDSFVKQKLQRARRAGVSGPRRSYCGSGKQHTFREPADLMTASAALAGKPAPSTQRTHATKSRHQ